MFFLDPKIAEIYFESTVYRFQVIEWSNLALTGHSKTRSFEYQK
jgi:hypothetical protein